MQYGTSLVTGLLKHMSVVTDAVSLDTNLLPAVTYTIERGTFGNKSFLCFTYLVA
jgi:hypothetical protein